MSLFPDSSPNARASRGSPEQPASAATSNIAEYSVSEISGALKRTVEETYGHIRVRGEISGYRGPHSSGHAYFSLKDERARIEAVIWRGSMSRIKFRPEEGMEVIATGKLTTYPGSSKYQIVIEQMEPAGTGALMALLEERKKKLGAEGLFEASRKQLIPFLPRVIGVVTSPTGAVIRDIIHRITDRFPLHVLVWPVRVQGETSGDEVANAVNGFNTSPLGAGITRPDVIIVARGGGSLEDLWGFNDESVVRAVAASSIPVIAAVGHETDWTLIDLVADVRAPTPTAAAEMAVPVKAELNAQLASLSARLGAAMSRLIDQRRQAYRSLQRALPSTDQLLALPRRRFDEATSRLERALQSNIIQKRTYFNGLSRHLSPRLLQQRLRERKNLLHVLTARLPRGLAVAIQSQQNVFRQTSIRLMPDLILRRTSQWSAIVNDYQRRYDQSIRTDLERNARRCTELARLMKSLSHNSVLERGFAIVFDAHGQPVNQATAIADHDHLSLRFKDGEVGVIATTILPSAPTKRQKSSKLKKSKPENKQGTLF